MLTMMLSITSNPRTDETGAVLVIFAAWMALSVLIMAFVIDVSNWHLHQEHLQQQADSAAYAAAQNFQYPCTSAVAESMYKTAGQYGGASSVESAKEGTFASPGPLYNAQVGESSPSNIHEEINKKAYFGQELKGAKAETSTVEAAPCSPSADMVDVKMTETNLPWFFSAFDVPFINAHARVSVTAETSASKVEPLIESEPRAVRVFYVNDTHCLSGKTYVNCPDGNNGDYENEVLATGLLTRVGANEENGTVSWSDESKPVMLTVNKVEHIGVRYALAEDESALVGKANEELSVCGHTYVECFDQDSGVVPPLLNIQGYSAEAEGKAVPFAPLSRRVTLTTEPGNTCSDAYFNKWPLSENSATCTVTLLAEVNYGNESSVTKGVTVVPKLVYTEGFSNRKVEAAQYLCVKKGAVEKGPSFFKTEAECYNPAAKEQAGNEGEWERKAALKYEGGLWQGAIKVPSYYYGNFGSVEIDLEVTCKPETGSPCAKGTKSETTTLKDVQRDFSAGPDGSNRVVGARIFEPGGLKPVPGERDADAFEFCEKSDENKCEHKLATTIELSGSLDDAKKYFNKEGQPIPPFHVLFGDNDQEDDDQFVMSCPPTTSANGIEAPWGESLKNGCEGKYSVNSQGGSCAKEAELNNHECVGLVAVPESTGNFAPAPGKRCEHFVPETPKPCENNEELLTLSFQHHLAARIENHPYGTKFECPNEWQNSSQGGVPTIKANDSRLIQFFVLPFTVTDFERNREKNPLIPIVNFATFYVTGWGSGNGRAGQGTAVPWNAAERRDGCSETLFHQESPWRIWQLNNKTGAYERKSIGPLTATERTELENEAIPLKQREQKEKEKGFDDDAEQPREILGHLIKYVNVLGEGSGNVACKEESYETCELKLTE
jgi:hypothetical protein